MEVGAVVLVNPLAEEVVDAVDPGAAQGFGRGFVFARPCSVCLYLYMSTFF